MGAVRIPILPHVRQVQHTTVRSSDGDGHDAGFSPDGNDVQPVGGQEFRSPLEHLLDREVRAALEFQQRGIRGKRLRQQF